MDVQSERCLYRVRGVTARARATCVDVDVYADDAVAEWLWAQVLGRARALGASAGHAAISVDIGIYQNDDAQRSRAGARGFAPVTTFQRMRIDFDRAARRTGRPGRRHRADRAGRRGLPPPGP